MSIFDPVYGVIAKASAQAAQKYIKGEMDKFEAFEYAESLVQQSVESGELTSACEEAWKGYADVKDIKFGDKATFTTNKSSVL